MNSVGSLAAIVAAVVWTVGLSVCASSDEASQPNLVTPGASLAVPSTTGYADQTPQLVSPSHTPEAPAATDGAQPPEVGTDSPLQVGQPAPELVLTSLTGDRVRLSDFRGREVLLIFWATWCSACGNEVPIVQKIFDESAGIPLAVITVECGDNQDTIRAFLTKHNLSFPVLLDGQSREGTTTYRVEFLPTIFVIDAAGSIRATSVGTVDSEAEFRHLIELGSLSP
jgi:peroxiredoxin